VDIEYSLLLAGSIVLTCVVGLVLLLSAWLEIGPSGDWRKALFTAFLVSGSFSIGVVIFAAYSFFLLILLPRDVCLIRSSIGRSCILRSHMLYQIAAGLIAAVILTLKGWDHEKHKSPDRAIRPTLAIILVAGGIASYFLATLDCHQIGVFCTRSEEVPGCMMLWLMVFGIIGYTCLAGRKRRNS
jgi:hypothetical protein